ncbi:MAG: pyridoxamine 5'-phosphate oxidase family protein [Pseudomonadota bacterium]
MTIRPTDDEARALARRLIDTARYGAIGVLDPDTGAPAVTRIAIATDEAGAPVTLISDLSHHTKALRAHAVCSLLVGEPENRGDPLTHPRLSITATASFIKRGSDDHAALRERYLSLNPKAKLYIDFTDFSFVRFKATSAALNGGFGKAFVLTAEDLS